MKTTTKAAAKRTQDAVMKRIGVLNSVQHTHGIAQSERDAAYSEREALWTEVARLEAIINPNPGPRTDSMFS